MKILQTVITDTEGKDHPTFGIEYDCPEGRFSCPDISFRREDAELLLEIVQFIRLPFGELPDFTADYVDLLSKYSFFPDDGDERGT